ncbi:hypothetical protein HDA32_005309 [Spinactinospora alkalitolerans]|uniref:Uncharacterized protein n=1 Tax=Spinactinospora alkalitolerans TaxID=687207 RepID=A0A852U1W9_9ACTN|nr:hypothetical protein [Spinactinospora alkalitolerans]
MRNPIVRYQARPPRGRASADRPRPYVPIPFTPAPPAYPVLPKAAMVRPYVLREEWRRRQRRDDRTRLGVAVLLDIARPLEAAA